MPDSDELRLSWTKKITLKEIAAAYEDRMREAAANERKLRDRIAEQHRMIEILEQRVKNLGDQIGSLRTAVDAAAGTLTGQFEALTAFRISEQEQMDKNVRAHADKLISAIAATGEGLNMAVVKGTLISAELAEASFSSALVALYSLSEINPPELRHKARDMFPMVTRSIDAHYSMIDDAKSLLIDSGYKWNDLYERMRVDAKDHLHDRVMKTGGLLEYIESLFDETGKAVNDRKV